MQGVCIRKQNAMKKFILFTIVALLSISVFAQNGIEVSAQQNRTIQKRIEATPQVKIYPNPCKNNKVNVEFKSHFISEIQLVNIAGKIVLHKNYNFTEAKKEIRLDNIQNGIYIIKIVATDNSTIVKKLIVSK